MGSGPQSHKHLPQSPFTGKFFEMTFCIVFYESCLFTLFSIQLASRLNRIFLSKYVNAFMGSLNIFYFVLRMGLRVGVFF
jgi:hypothetical protein